MNATFDANNWNSTMDASAIADGNEYTIKNFDASKHTISVEIKDLCMIPDGNDKISLGHYDFSKVGIAGKITKVEENEGGITYVVTDMEDSAYSVRCCVYSTSTAYESKYVEGSVIRTCGKLHYHDGQLEVIVLTMSEVEDLAEVDVYKWEARLAKIEFGRGLLGLLYNNPSALSGLKGYGILNNSKENGGAAPRVAGNKASDDPQSLGERIIKHLRDSGQEKFSIDEMATHFSVAVEVVNRAVEKLEHEGNVFIDGEGTYGLGC
uniref:RPA_C domain-containing protein n=1 Tax=Strongyloides papillosus TaxID=174720 RepID=A0A0N5BF66_STREA